MIFSGRSKRADAAVPCKRVCSIKREFEKLTKQIDEELSEKLKWNNESVECYPSLIFLSDKSYL